MPGRTEANAGGRLQRALLPGIAILALAAAAIGVMRAESTPGDDEAQASRRSEIAELREGLARETLARQILESRLLLLERRAGSGSVVRRGRSGHPSASEPRLDAAAESASEGSDGLTPAAEASGDVAAEAKPWFDEAALAALGMSSVEIERLRRIWEEHELDRAYIQAEAIRGGYDHRKRHWREQIGLELAFRGDLGDDTYERVLYATGQPNRTVVGDLLSQSAASSAGLERGDVIWRYDGATILRPEELQNASSSGQQGEQIPIEVIRNGEHVRLFIQRGPLGVRLDRKHVSPEAGD